MDAKTKTRKEGRGHATRVMVSFPVTPAEAETIELAAIAAGQSRAEYIRKRLLPVPEITPGVAPNASSEGSASGPG